MQKQMSLALVLLYQYKKIQPSSPKNYNIYVPQTNSDQVGWKQANLPTHMIQQKCKAYAAEQK